MSALLRAFFGYLFLLLIIRVVGRRPGRQLTPFEFVLVFYIGGLALTAMVGDERSITNAVCQILTVAVAHHSVAWARSRSRRLARLLDGTPLLLLKRGADGQGRWRSDTMARSRVSMDDVMFSARDHGIGRAEELEQAALERNGEITVIGARGPGSD